jgi:head-tail adaptor
LNSGKLNKRVTIRAKTQSTDGTGFVTDDSTADTVIWGMVKPLSAKRNLEEGRDFSATSMEVTIRYNANIVTNIGDYVLVYLTNEYQIHNWLTVDEENHFVKLICSKT